jgi:precorrin-2/cobalt-factor-2 C20-methyltransferase
MTPEEKYCPGQADGYGTLYGVGVGPGAPDLITLRAVTILKTISTILAAASPKNDSSLALSIANPHLPDNCEVLRLDFPMTRNTAVLEAAWAKNADSVLAVLRSGRDAAFLTLGDPLIYSTFGYLMRTLLARVPQLPVVVVPGITSYQEAAARTKTILCEGEENLLLLSGINKPDRLVRDMAIADNAVILKTYRNMQDILAALRASGKSAEAVFASRVGLEGEIFTSGCGNLPSAPHYLSLFLVPPMRASNTVE